MHQPFGWNILRHRAGLSAPWIRLALLNLLAGFLLCGCVVDENALITFPTPTLAAESSEIASPPAEMAAEESQPRDDDSDDIEAGFTAEGYPYLGSPEAPVVVWEYSDFHCPYCRQHNRETLPTYVERFIRTGQVQYVARDLPLEGLHPHAIHAHRAALCMAQQSASAFWWMHSRLYETQSHHAQGNDVQGFFLSLVEEYNASGDEADFIDVNAFTACQSGNAEIDGRIQASVQEALEMGINGTPTFLVFHRANPARVLPISGAYDFEVFEDVTENLERYLTQMEGQRAEQGELPFWISDMGLAPARLWDASGPNAEGGAAAHWEGLTTAQDHFKGSPLADLVIFEFSDFQCPYCRRHTEDTQPQLDEAYVRTGKIMWVFKHFPLAIHPQAPAAAQAAMCAGQQGRFWDMHDFLFARPEEWSNRQPADTFLAYGRQMAEASNVRAELRMEPVDGALRASDLETWERMPAADFDLAAFEACLGSDEFEELITEGMEDVSGIVQGTPTFLVWHREYGLLVQPIVGSLPEDQFASLFDRIFTQLAEIEAATE